MYLYSYVEIVDRIIRLIRPWERRSICTSVDGRWPNLLSETSGGDNRAKKRPLLVAAACLHPTDVTVWSVRNWLKTPLAMHPAWFVALPPPSSLTGVDH